ncbi:type III secretion system inner rod subunit SctI [Dryocola sp. BD626]|uniref:type III secretion system inner rod subunit SctI n=1 Tax=Dryocola sp. BD626 TaxID=3133273 RepID=UPI003F508801
MQISTNALSNTMHSLAVQEEDVFSLDDRLLEAISISASNSAAEKEDILQSLERPGLVNRPDELYALQLRSANYNLEVSMISTLTRKAVSAVESLLRS